MITIVVAKANLSGRQALKQYGEEDHRRLAAGCCAAARLVALQHVLACGASAGALLLRLRVMGASAMHRLFDFVPHTVPKPSLLPEASLAGYCH